MFNAHVLKVLKKAAWGKVDHWLPGEHWKGVDTSMPCWRAKPCLQFIALGAFSGRRTAPMHQSSEKESLGMCLASVNSECLNFPEKIPSTLEGPPTSDVLCNAVDDVSSGALWLCILQGQIGDQTYHMPLSLPLTTQVSSVSRAMRSIQAHVKVPQPKHQWQNLVDLGGGTCGCTIQGSWRTGLPS